jgi:hypothetical protein
LRTHGPGERPYACKGKILKKEVGMMMKSMLALFVSLALGYGVCVLANKEKGVMKTLGLSIGILILVASIGLAIMKSCIGPMYSHCMKGGEPKCMLMK